MIISVQSTSVQKKTNKIEQEAKIKWTDNSYFLYKSDISTQVASQIAALRSAITSLHKGVLPIIPASMQKQLNMIDSRLLTNETNIKQQGISISTNLKNINTNIKNIKDITTTQLNHTWRLRDLEDKYGLTTTLNYHGEMYIKGFGLNSLVTTEKDKTTSDDRFFNISAETLNISTLNSDNKVKANEDGLYFETKQGHVSKYLRRSETFVNHPSGSTITLRGLNRTPIVILTPSTIPCYQGVGVSQNQTFTLTTTNVIDNVLLAGTYTFTPVAQLNIASDLVIIKGASVYNSPSSNIVLPPLKVTKVITNPTITFNIKTQEGTGVSNNYHVKNAKFIVETSPDNKTWSQILSFKSLQKDYVYRDLLEHKVSFTLPGVFVQNTYIRITAKIVNTGEKFTWGVKPQRYYREVKLSKTVNFPYFVKQPYTTDMAAYWYYSEYGLSGNDVRDKLLPKYVVTNVTTEVYYGDKKESYDRLISPVPQQALKFSYTDYTRGRTVYLKLEGVLANNPKYSSKNKIVEIGQIPSNIRARIKFASDYFSNTLSFMAVNKPYIALVGAWDVNTPPPVHPSIITTTINAFFDNKAPVSSKVVKNSIYNVVLQSTVQGSSQLSNGTMNIICLE